MGDIRRFKSDCGYSEDIYYGVGRNAIDVRQVEKRFPESYETVKAGRLSGKISGTLIHTELGVCMTCRKIVPVDVLVITCSDRSVVEVRGKCPHCGDTPKSVDLNEAVICPKCGSPMETEVVGDWD
jgi:hypothetical protein